MSSILPWFSRSRVGAPAASGPRPHARDAGFVPYMIAELLQRLAAVHARGASDTSLVEPVATLAREARQHGFAEQLLSALDATSEPALHVLADVLADHFDHATPRPAEQFVAQIVATLPAPPAQLLQAADVDQLGAWLGCPVPRAWEAMRELTAIQSRVHAVHGVTTAFAEAMDAACQSGSARLAVNVAMEACARAINAAPHRSDVFACAAATIAVWFAAAELFNRGARTSAADLVATHLRALQAAGLPATVAARALPERLPQADAFAVSGQAALARLRVLREAAER